MLKGLRHIIDRLQESMQYNEKHEPPIKILSK